MKAERDGRAPVLLTVDLEDWHQLVGRAVRYADWDRPHNEFEHQVDDTLSLLRELGVRATFFVLGITAKNHPRVVERVCADGHEIACHGWAHIAAWKQTPDEFRRDVGAGRAALEAVGVPAPAGYRAPAFSLTTRTPWAYAALADLGFQYDSSHNTSALIRGCFPAEPCPYRIDVPGRETILELPVAVARIAGRPLPIGGGSYWRVLPHELILRALDRLTAERGFPVLYFHPYELGRRPLRLKLPSGTSPGVRARRAWKTVRYNPGRGGVAALLTRVADRFRLASCAEELAGIEEAVATAGGLRSTRSMRLVPTPRSRTTAFSGELPASRHRAAT